MFRGCIKIEISPTPTETCIYPYKIGANVSVNNYTGMFTNTKNYNGFMTPTENTIYYTSNEIK